ncbi:DNA-binding protein (plasmid) [Dyella sp. BiH032]|uniref:DNA-binding protein n=1 Tax=Dyella sp. BiH032 TaxID=3075430 RepID=UPI0028933F4D|nr:DNA-binding protein [Dyella sp. BiH032]WNL48586.1 DNA-binding protein [Dyella sp. BiH032]
MAGVSREDVWAVADRLVSEGKRPTLALVRSALGGGSYSTIHPAFIAWRQERSEKVALPTDKAPAGVVDRVNALVSVIWQQATDDAAARFDGERRALQGAADKASQRADEVDEALAQCAEELDRANERTDQAEKTLSQVRIDMGALAQELAEAKQFGAAQAAAKTEAEAWIADLRVQLDQARSDAARAREEAMSVRLELAEVSGQLGAAKATNADLLAKLTPNKKG